MDIKYIIIDLSDADKINYNEVLQNSISTLRISKSNKAIVYYSGGMPQSVQSLENKSQEYNLSEITEILRDTDWTYFDGGITGNTNNY